MRYLTSVLLLTLFAAVAIAQVQVNPLTTKARRFGEYRKKLEELKALNDNLDNEQWYNKHFRFKDRDSGKEKVFKDFKKLDRRMFMLTTAQKMAFYLKNLAEIWDDEATELPDAAASDGKDESPATKTDVQKFSKELNALRKTHIATWERMAKAVFKDFPKEFSENERTLYMKQLQTLKKQIEAK